MSLSRRLQSNNPDERLGALYRLFYLGLPKQLLSQALAGFSRDPDERIQVAILDWVDDKSYDLKENVSIIMASFEHSQFPVVRALVRASKDKNKFTTLMDYDTFCRFFPEGTLSELDEYRLRPAWIRER